MTETTLRVRIELKDGNTAPATITFHKDGGYTERMATHLLYGSQDDTVEDIIQALRLIAYQYGVSA